MTTLHLTDDELVLHYYGEMSEAAEARACAHLERCTTCRANLAALQRVMSAIDSAPAPEPDASFEQRAWARLEPEILRLKPEAARPPGVFRLTRRLFGREPDTNDRRAFRAPLEVTGGAGRWQAIAWGTAAALVVIAAFVAGRFLPTPGAPAPSASADVTPVRERVLLVDLGDHLDRTETALVEFVSGTDGRDLASGRSRAEELVAANRLYRRTATLAGDQGVADVLDELERILIEIAGTSPDASTSDLDVVRRRIDMRGLLFKVRVMRDQLQERATGTVNVKGQDTTI